MAASDERAGRIRDLKESRPDLTWERIADYCGVKERSAIEWSRTGGITHDNCVKLAKLFEVPDEWLWSGRQRVEGTPDLLSTLRPASAGQLDRVEAKLDAILKHLGISQSAADQIADELEAAAQNGHKQSDSTSTKQPARKQAAR